MAFAFGVAASWVERAGQDQKGQQVMAGRPMKEGVRRDPGGRSRGLPINIELRDKNRAIIAAARAGKKIPCCVYMIVPRPFMWPTKVGVSKNVRTRLSELQTGSHMDLEIIHSVICEDERAARTIEKDILDTMASKGWAIRGEWVEGGSDMILEMVKERANELGIVWALDMEYEIG